MYVGVCDPKEVGVAVCVCEPVKCALALSITHILRLMSESVCVYGRGAKGVSQDTWKTWETLIAGLRAASFVISSSSDFELVIKLDCTYCQLPDLHPLPPSSTS